MNEPVRCDRAEAEDLRDTKNKTAAQTCLPGSATVQPEALASSAKQLMCSQDRAEVEAVKEELNKAGISTETRNNATAEALGVTGIELWVKHERDFDDATSLYAKMQAFSRACPPATASNSKGEPAKPAGGSQAETTQSRSPGGKEGCSPRGGEPNLDKLDQDSSLLEKKIEEMLEFQREVVSQCVFVRAKTKEFRVALVEKQAAISLENEKRAVTQKKQAEQISGLQISLQGERSERAQLERQLDGERVKREKAEAQLASERQEWEQKSKAQEDSFRKAQEKLDVQSRLIQTHAAAVLKLTKEVAALEARREEEQKLVAKIKEEFAMERKARMAAEQKAESATAPTSMSLPSLLFRRLSPKKANAN